MGFCWPCVSLSGGVYFAASVHICIGLFMLSYLTYSFLAADVVPSDHSFFFICILYALTFLILGCFIFSGIEKKSVRVLKPSAIIFGVLHGVIFLRVMYVILSNLILIMTNPEYSSSHPKAAVGIMFFTFLFFATVIYLAILTIYIRDLQTSNNSGNLFSQIQLGVGSGDGNPLYAYNAVHCQP